VLYASVFSVRRTNKLLYPVAFFIFFMSVALLMLSESLVKLINPAYNLLCGCHVTEDDDVLLGCDAVWTHR
jgi:hypothetical protein